MKCRISITATITWNDGDNALDTRPATVELVLYRDGSVYETATIDTAGDNKHTFVCLPRWQNSKHKYTYTVDLSELPSGYTKEVIGYNIINTIEPVNTTIEGSKTWIDTAETITDRPPEITVSLFQNGLFFDSVQVTSPSELEATVPFTFTDIPVFDNEGNLYIYTVDEEDLPLYDKMVEGFEITNSHIIV